MMESSMKLESSLYISFCYEGDCRECSRYYLPPLPPLCQNVMEKQARLIWPTGDTFGMYTPFML